MSGSADGRPARTLAARLAPFLPTRLVAATARFVYPRFEPELARLADLCPPGCGTAVDVGGWYGPWTRRLAPLARRVVTVEPVPHLARLLSSAAPDNVRVIRAAASDHRGTALLWLPADDAGDRGVSSLVRRDIHARALEVPCLTLDGLGLSDVGFVKIDVDGNEPAVLRGARDLLARDRPPCSSNWSPGSSRSPRSSSGSPSRGTRAGCCPAPTGCRSPPSRWRRTRHGCRTSSHRVCCAGCSRRADPGTSTRCCSCPTGAVRARAG
jgi:methyltransferase, FkbM family